ncbi:MAG: T9SS type A sorting domain-containing protein [Sphingobacteriaceae bacterium]|nr:MAG: T9SS type A sorting domain-containing protein [Sphingobacteriaceae bacterium]
MKSKIIFFLLIVLLSTCITYLSFAQEATPQFKATPIVIKGADYPLLSTFKSVDMVGFKYSNNRWQQIIIQVDEKVRVTGSQIYNNQGLIKTANREDSWDGRGGNEYEYNGKFGGLYYMSVYADGNTFTGIDTNAFFDRDDELVYMAKDGGTIPPNNDLFPAGIDKCSGVQLKNDDPNTGITNYIYIFRRDLNYQSPATGTYLSQDGGLPHPVVYDFQFKSKGQMRGPADYKEHYNRQYGPNPENTTVTTPNYSKGFTDRWVEEKLIITTPPSSPDRLTSAGIDIIDGYKVGIVSLTPNEVRGCGRSEYTFAGIRNERGGLRPLDGTAANSEKGYGGAFISNINGPLRAIRSTIGGNSGVLTQRDNFLYEQTEVINNILRVHPTDGLMSFVDYNPQVGTMIYNNNNNMPATQYIINGHVYTGILVDGKPDNITQGEIDWELVNSASGSILRYNRIYNPDRLNLFGTTYYYDNLTPEASEPQCTGDNISWGASGSIVRNRDAAGKFIPMPNTDTRYSGAVTLATSQFIAYLQPETPLSERTAWMNIVNNLVAVTATAWQNTADCEAKRQVEANIYPNPSDGKLTLKVGGDPYQKVKIAIYDILGRQVYKAERTGTIDDSLDLRGKVITGLYIVTITINDYKLTRKLVISQF